MKALDAVHGDVLPQIGEEVLIHLAREDKWVAHTVCGYYAWPDLGGNKWLQRVCVRVRDSQGYLNARNLCEVRRPDGTYFVLDKEFEPEGRAVIGYTWTTADGKHRSVGAASHPTEAWNIEPIYYPLERARR